MEFLRFGSSIPGNYWGCCACDIIQNFKVDPDEKASIEVVNGDGNHTTGKFVGKTWKEIFLARLRFGTFSTTDMPNHAFIAILTQWQIENTYGKKWLAILKENGFEFIRTVNNSVYTGTSLVEVPSSDVTQHDNHIFMLIRNIGNGAIKDPFTPPKAWTDLPSVKLESWDELFDEQGSPTLLAESQFSADKAVWEKLGPPKFYTEAELEKEGIPIWYAGVRNKYPQELKANRLEKKTMEKLNNTPSPFGTPSIASVNPFGEAAPAKE
jgi:hypothetical protein